MCGITGYYKFKESGDLSSQLRESTAKLSLRGPDMSGIWEQGKVGFGHRRLSILDTSEQGKQPMLDTSGRYSLIFNGEIYNFRELRLELEKEGIKFRSDTDTEVLLYGLIKWGKAFLKRLNGFFAFAFYDRESDYLIVARDRFGIKPLVFYFDEYSCFFSSELKALTCFPIPKKINRESLNLYFQLTYIPVPFTIYKDVHKLEPGEMIEIDNGAMSKERYYNLEKERTVISNFDNAKNQLRKLLDDSVTKRLIADVPLGTFLSGGIDSSVISTIASHHVDELHTFSIGYKDHPFFDETGYAELVAKKIGSHHHTFKLGNDDLLENVKNAIDYFDEPFADSSALPMFILSKLTRGQVTVALSGDGADEIFSGYNKHEAWMRSLEKSALNSLIKSDKFILRMLPKSRQNKWTNYIRQAYKYQQILHANTTEKYWRLASFIPQKEVEMLLNNDWRAELDEIKEGLLGDLESDDLNSSLAMDVKLVLSGDMLTKVDWMSMSNSLEVRVPFLDHNVVEFAFQLPDEFKMQGKFRKYILKEAFKDDLPVELMSRGKHGFEVPLLDWFKNELLSELDSLVFNKERNEELGIFNWSELSTIRKQLHSRNPGDVHIKVWQLYVFMNWLKNSELGFN